MGGRTKSTRLRFRAAKFSYLGRTKSHFYEMRAQIAHLTRNFFVEKFPDDTARILEDFLTRHAMAA